DQQHPQDTPPLGVGSLLGDVGLIGHLCAPPVLVCRAAGPDLTTSQTSPIIPQPVNRSDVGSVPGRPRTSDQAGGTVELRTTSRGAISTRTGVAPDPSSTCRNSSSPASRPTSRRGGSTVVSGISASRATSFS